MSMHAGEQARVGQLLHRLAAGAGGVEHQAVVVVARARLATACTQGVVTPNMVSADGRLGRRRRERPRAWAIMPASAWAALASTRSGDAVDARHVGDRVHHADVATGRHRASRRREATVDTITLGTPIGRRRMAGGGQRGAARAAGRDDAAEVAARRATKRSKASAIAATARPRSPVNTARSPSGMVARHLARMHAGGRRLARGRQVDRHGAQAELLQAVAQEERARGPWCRRCRRHRRRAPLLAATGNSNTLPLGARRERGRAALAGRALSRGRRARRAAALATHGVDDVGHRRCGSAAFQRVKPRTVRAPGGRSEAAPSPSARRTV